KNCWELEINYCAMITTKEMNAIIYQDEAHLIEHEGWAERFYELWMERYHALNIVRKPSKVFKLGKEVLLKIIKTLRFDEMHLFKVYDGANVYALLTDAGDGYWRYEFIVINAENQDRIETGLHTVEELKQAFGGAEPILEIPLPNDRKYVDDASGAQGK